MPMKRWGKISYRDDFKRQEVPGSHPERNIELVVRKGSLGFNKGGLCPRSVLGVTRIQLVINAIETDEVTKKLSAVRERDKVKD